MHSFYSTVITLEAQVVGKIDFAYKFGRNYQSFPSIVLDCTGLSAPDYFPSEDRHISACIESLQKFLAKYNNDSNSGNVMDESLRNGIDGLSSSLEYFRSALLEVNNDGGSLLQSFRTFASPHAANDKHSVLPLYKAATLTKSFLTSLNAELLSSPPVTMDLVERMLAIFNSLVADREQNKDLPARSKGNGKGDSFLIHKRSAIENLVW